MENQHQPFLRLPQELVEEVARYLPAEEKSLLCRTCKQVYVLTIKAVYKDINMNWICTGRLRRRGTDLDQNGTNTRIGHLIRTLLERPELSKQVSSIKLDSNAYHYYGTGTLPSLINVPRRVKQAIWRNLQKMEDFKPCETWERAIQTHDIQCYAAVLIWLCPNISELFLGDTFIRSNFFLEQIIDSSSRYQNLKQITIGSTKQGYHTPLGKDRVATPAARLGGPDNNRFLLNFLRLPVLRDFCLQDVTYPRNVSVSDSLRNRVLQLTALRVCDCNVSPSQLKQILWHTPQVTRLDYVFTHDFVRRVDKTPFNFDLPPLRSCLDSFKGRLTHLTLCCPFWPYMNLHADFGEDDEHFSFAGFTSLVSLQTSLVILGGWCLISGRPETIRTFVGTFWDRLPPNLQRLHLCEDVHSSYNYNLDFRYQHWSNLFSQAFGVRNRGSLLRQLQQLHIECYERKSSKFLKEMDKMDWLCEKNDLLFSFHFNTVYDGPRHYL